MRKRIKEANQIIGIYRGGEMNYRPIIEPLLREGMSQNQVIAKAGIPEEEWWQVEAAMEDPTTYVDEHEYRATLLLEVR